MSYFPESACANTAVDALLRPPPAFFPHPSPEYDRDALREVLIALVCPQVCDGVVQGEGWHRECETRADTAIAALEADQ